MHYNSAKNFVAKALVAIAQTKLKSRNRVDTALKHLFLLTDAYATSVPGEDQDNFSNLEFINDRYTRNPFGNWSLCLVARTFFCILILFHNRKHQLAEIEMEVFTSAETRPSSKSSLR